MTLLSIDPGRSYKGEKTIGYCVFSGMGIERERGELTFEELAHWLDVDEFRFLTFGTLKALYEIDVVVIEDFVNNPQSKGGQRNGTSECIGAVEILCLKSTAKFVRHPPSALGPAKLHAPKGSFEPLAHLRHEDSAFLHGHEYLIETGVLTVSGLSTTL